MYLSNSLHVLLLWGLLLVPREHRGPGTEQDAECWPYNIGPQD